MKRDQLQTLKQRIAEPRKHIQVLYGPRQVGKTTIVTQLLGTIKIPARYAIADAIEANQESWIGQQWEAARFQYREDPGTGTLLILDEIQKISNWSEYVKKEWDSDTADGINIKVILLGSSRLLLQQGLTESLTGRFETIYVPHWSLGEMKELTGMSYEEYIWFGGYPGAGDLIKDEIRWKQYILNSIIETSISRDILMLSRVDKPALIRQLFEIGCTYSGQIVSFNKILGQLQDAGNTTTLSHYLRLLDQAGLLAGLPKFSPEMIRQRASFPKFQVHNMALMSALEPSVFNAVRQNPTRWGRWIESAIGSHLLNQCIANGYDLHYWRDGNDEVDFILEGLGKTIAIEVKTAASHPRQGMEKFRKKYNPDRVLLVGKSGIPVEEFLLADVESLF